MDTEDFYQKIVNITEQPAAKRHSSLLDLHRRACNDYSEALRQITPPGATRVVPDGRTVAQIVGHFVEWDKMFIIALSEILAGEEWPRLMSLGLNINLDGQVREFGDVDEANAYIASVYTDKRWEDVQSAALDVAATQLRLFENPTLLTADRLEATRRSDRFMLPGGENLSMPCGWNLWIWAIEHEAVAHITDLHLGRSAYAVSQNAISK